MGRPRIIQFYEKPLSDNLPEEHKWLIAYHESSRQLKEYLDERGADIHTSLCAVRCLSALRSHLLEAGIPYSEEAASSWLHAQDQKFTLYSLTLKRFADINTYGEVQASNSFPRKGFYPKTIQLDEPWDSLSSAYLETLSVLFVTLCGADGSFFLRFKRSYCIKYS